MTQDDIIRMAREAGWNQGTPQDDCRCCSLFDLERFAALVAAAEREECAKVAATVQDYGLNVATAIRARGTHD